MPYTLITGASRGIGRCMVEKLAQLNHNLLLVALAKTELEETARNVAEQYQVNVISYSMDITDYESVIAFRNWCYEQDISINILINNAGMGLQGDFEKLSLEDNLSMINLNNQAMVTLTHLFLPWLREFRQSYILNVGSIASYLKFPYKAVYSGSKNFVLAFSNALREELKSDNINVSCLCPGPTITNAHVEARTQEQGFKARMMTVPASDVADKGIKGMFAGKSTIVPGRLNHLAIFLIKHLPSSISTKFLKKMFANSQHN